MTLRARFEGGMCPTGCGNRIHAGDPIRYSAEHGAFVHATCTPIVEARCVVCGRDKPCRCEED